MIMYFDRDGKEVAPDQADYAVELEFDARGLVISSTRWETKEPKEDNEKEE